MTMLDKVSLQLRAEEFGVKLSSSMCEQFGIYSELLAKWSNRINLTSVDEKSFLGFHFLDSLSLAKIFVDHAASLKLAPLKIIDVGTGAGFPGLPIKIAFPHINLTLLEPNIKKIRFLENLTSELGIQANILNERAENIARLSEYRETFHLAVARALADKKMLVELLLPLVAMDGKAVFMLGKSDISYDSNFEEHVNEVGGAIQATEEYCLERRPENSQISDLPIQRYLLVLRKCRATPERFPRSISRMRAKGA